MRSLQISVLHQIAELCLGSLGQAQPRSSGDVCLRRVIVLGVWPLVQIWVVVGTQLSGGCHLIGLENINFY